MEPLTKQQINEIADQLESVGLKSDSLKEELLDHICCVIEDNMNRGMAFAEAKTAAFQTFGKDEMQELEQKSLELLNQKSVIMKKVSLITAACLLLFSTMLWSLQTDPPSISPLDGQVEITSSFGMRKHPVLKKKKMHQGIDFKAKLGTPVYATSDGVVIKVIKGHQGYGNYLMIRHDEQYETLYSHLDADFEVKEGQEVKRGQRIGMIGEPNPGTGPHLHYEVLKDGEHQDPGHYLGL